MPRKEWVLALALLIGAGGGAVVEAQQAPEPRPRREVMRRGWLGIAFEASRDGRERREGTVVITDVLPESPAHKAGLQRGDTILSWNGRADIPAALEARALQPGDTVKLRVRRAGRARDLTVVAGQRPARLLERVRSGEEGDVFVIRPGALEHFLHQHADEMALHADSLHRRLRTMLRDSLGPRLRALEGEIPEIRIHTPRRGEGPGAVHFELETGMRGVAGAEFAEVNAGLAEYFGTDRGALVLRVVPETPAARAGLQPGDVVVRAGGQPVATVRDLRRAVAGTRDDKVALEVLRKGTRRQLEMRWE